DWKRGAFGIEMDWGNVQLDLRFCSDQIEAANSVNIWRGSDGECDANPWRIFTAQQVESLSLNGECSLDSIQQKPEWNRECLSLPVPGAFRTFQKAFESVSLPLQAMPNASRHLL